MGELEAEVDELRAARRGALLGANSSSGSGGGRVYDGDRELSRSISRARSYGQDDFQYEPPRRRRDGGSSGRGPWGWAKGSGPGSRGPGRRGGQGEDDWEQGSGPAEASEPLYGEEDEEADERFYAEEEEERKTRRSGSGGSGSGARTPPRTPSASRRAALDVDKLKDEALAAMTVSLVHSQLHQMKQQLLTHPLQQ